MKSPLSPTQPEHENYLRTQPEKGKYLRTRNYVAVPAYYHIKCVYRKSPCGRFNYVRSGARVARVIGGNDVENVCPTLVSVETDESSLDAHGKEGELGDVGTSFIIKTTRDDRKFMTATRSLREFY
jgi:hypothetical protein